MLGTLFYCTFDAARMCVVDPMHNLLFGTTKHMVELWKTIGILTSKEYDDIQAKVDSFVCPADIGRVPSKIILFIFRVYSRAVEKLDYVFSLFALKGTFARQHYNYLFKYDVTLCVAE